MLVTYGQALLVFVQTMGHTATFRALQAAERRQQREEQSLRREYERQAKEREKLSAIEQARLEVRLYENQLNLLLSMHKEYRPAWDWAAVASALPPLPPKRNPANEFKAMLQLALTEIEQKATGESFLEQARATDDCDFEAAKLSYCGDLIKWEKLRKLAQRILIGEHKAYTQALLDLNPFAELSYLGSSINLTVHNSRFVECSLKVNGKQAIPSETKSLTATEKLSTKPMSKARFHEVYTEYICSCVLRVALEVIALLPTDDLIVTAIADVTEQQSGRSIEKPVLSILISRIHVEATNFNDLNVYDAIEALTHRGDLRGTRKLEFREISPLKPEDLSHVAHEHLELSALISKGRKQCEEMRLAASEYKRRADAATAETTPV